MPQSNTPPIESRLQHLVGRHLPDLTLYTSQRQTVKLAHLKGSAVIYLYTKTGRPGKAMPHDWDDIPGAHGSTPESCNFRDHYTAFRQRHITVLGLSTQTSDFQREAKYRLALPFELISDPQRKLGDAFDLPTFRTEGMYFYQRLTLIIHNAKITQVFFPVNKPEHHAEEVLAWFNKLS